MVKVIIFVGAIMLFLPAKGSELKMPSFSTVGESVTFSCSIDIADSKILSVTWLKDGLKFYRYEFSPSKVGFASLMRGISVDRSDIYPNGNIIRIKLLTKESCGRYTCLVEMKHPSIKFVEMCGTLSVADSSEPDTMLQKLLF